MAKINGQEYSPKEIIDYKIRIKLEVIGMDYSTTNFDIYTTETNKNKIHNALANAFVKKTMGFKILLLTSKEQDDATSKLIEETLNKEI